MNDSTSLNAGLNTDLNSSLYAAHQNQNTSFATHLHGNVPDDFSYQTSTGLDVLTLPQETILTPPAQEILTESDVQELEQDIVLFNVSRTQFKKPENSE